MSLTINLVNNSPSNTSYAYVYGNNLDTGALFFIQADGSTIYYPESPGGTNTPLAVDCGIPLNGVGGGAKEVTLPFHANSGRIYFSLDEPMTFQVNPGPAAVQPSESNSADPNYAINWNFAEFTFDTTQLYADITYVDFVAGFPIGMDSTSQDGSTQKVIGLPADGLAKVAQGIHDQNDKEDVGWNSLVINQNGADLRVLSPNSGIALDGSLFPGYYDDYVNQVFDKYANEPLMVDTGAAFGVVSGMTDGNGAITFADVGFSFTKPTTQQIFANAGGPFDVPADPPAAANIIPILGAGFIRSTLLNDANTPDTVGEFYPDGVPTDHYSRIVHANEVDLKGYAFPYDDVPATDSGDQSGKIVDPTPQQITFTVGGGN